WYRAITYTHLRYKHAIADPKSYKEKYALAKIASREVRKRISDQKLLVDRHAVEYIRRKWGKVSLKEITSYLGIHASTIRAHARRMGLGLLVEKWDERKVIKSLRRARRLGVPLNSGEARKTMGPLYKAAIKAFRSWRNALTQAGIPYEAVARRGPFESWTDERIFLEARGLHREGKDRDYRFLQQHHSRLYSAARNHFGSWMEMLRAAGLVSDS
ncbi:MAG TPA: hypothetical protein VMU54_10705, partial [Planctomycetota bacterium]|nr:hypothetical protein [Planctomycetota bacterium]